MVLGMHYHRRDPLPPQNPGRSFESDYNAHLRESALRAIYRDHLRESALRDDIAGVGPETFPPTSPGNSGLSRNEYVDEEPITPEGQVRPGRSPSPGHSTRAELSRGRAQTIAPPFHLLSFGSFEAVKVRAQSKGKWILANVQTDESESHELNNVWRNSEIQDIIQKHFIFWQIYDDYEEGQKINHWYKIDKKPAVLVVDPHTGYKMDHVEGTVDTQQLIEILRPYTEKAPVAESSKYLEDSKNSSVVPREVGRNEYPALPREPARGTPGVVNIAIRLPYGSRIQRQFLATDPIQVLWSFAATEIPEDKDFVLVSPTRGLKLNFDDRKSIEEAGVADSVLTLFFRK